MVDAYVDDALGRDDAVGLARRIAAREVGAGELVEAAIARIEKVDGELNAMAVRDYDRARQTHGAPGFFHGVPTLIKDNVDVAGLPTQQGCDAYVGRPAAHDGDIARLIKSMGVVALGKTQLSEFGFSAAADHPRLGPVRSPWDTARYAGASSSGTAALVAAGAVPFAHGNDGGGSIRIPAAVNGLVGLKPSRGRLPLDPMNRQMPLRIVVDGVLTRSVRDTAAFFREAERRHRAPGLTPIGDVTGPSKDRLRIAFFTSAAGHAASPEVDALTRRTAELLESLGHTVEEVEAPVTEAFADDFVLYWGFLALMIVRLGRMTAGPTWDTAKLDNLTRGLAANTARRLHLLPGVVRRLRRSSDVSTEFHATHDVVLTPTLAHETPLVGHLDPTQSFDVIMAKLRDWVAFTPWQNVSGDPAISLPLATTENGLPQGMMLGAGRGREGLLLGLAHELEEAVGLASLGGSSEPA
ncbi:amidase [Nocardioides terrae]|uniref:Amidase n=1 Tax=Nocardioides terrae TaxID=574651 RepID=A0A1I1KGD3_9ACTN|nr:amidase [Nocardioides terrae]SFC59889.1 amidase [Nocardioides terrae]